MYKVLKSPLVLGLNIPGLKLKLKELPLFVLTLDSQLTMKLLV